VQKTRELPASESRIFRGIFFARFILQEEPLMETTIAIGKHEERLLGRKKEIAAVLDHLRQESAEVTGNRHFDWVDQAWDNNAARTVDRLTELYLSELASVERALARIRNGTFGSCRACRRPIEPARLNSFPQTEFCRECRELRESFEAAA
jgi:DnaK suppressor protein